MTSENSTQTAGKETIRFDDIVSESKVQSGKELSKRTIGYRLAVILLIYLGTVTVFLCVDYFYRSPSLPDFAQLTADKLNAYKEISSSVTERTLSLFDQLVQKSFLPVFTAILGYIFGTRGVEKEEES